MKVMKWSETHRDTYVYSHKLRRWIKARCSLHGMGCTAPATLPRGTKFSYNAKSTPILEYYADLALERAAAL